MSGSAKGYALRRSRHTGLSYCLSRFLFQIVALQAMERDCFRATILMQRAELKMRLVCVVGSLGSALLPQRAEARSSFWISCDKALT